MNKFHDIFLELEQQIVQGDYQPGDLLPSEKTRQRLDCAQL